MSLTLDDVDRWEPAAITAVFDAAIARAAGSRTAADTVGQLTVFADWDGDAGQAAVAAAHRTALDLTEHADACDAVARAAQTAAAQVAAIKTRLGEIRAEAARHHLTLLDSGVVALPADLMSYSPADQKRIIDAAVALQAALSRLLRDAESADDDLAAAIRGADGDLSAAGVDAQLSHGTVGPLALPSADAAPEEVDRWWTSLTPDQQDFARATTPDAIRNRDGIPAWVRGELNGAALTAELSRLERGWLDVNGTWRTDVGKRDELRALNKTLNDHPGSTLLLLDTTSQTDRVLAAVAVGDVDNAERVAVTVPGLGSTVGTSVEGMVSEAVMQRDQAVELRTIARLANPDSVASIAWIGYRTPGDWVEAGLGVRAEDATDPLNRFYRGLEVAGFVDDPQLVAFGHSYGSIPVSLALQEGAPVDDVVLYGSPGARLADASQLGVQPGHAYFMIGENDHIANWVSQPGAHGTPVQDVPGMVELSTATGTGLPRPLGDGQIHERAYGHSEYARVGSNGELRMSGYNLSAVLAGVPRALIPAGR